MKNSFLKLERGLRMYGSEALLILLAWLGSIFLTRDLFARSPYSDWTWFTAHVLASLRSFEAWGFWKLWGVSLMVPHTAEFQGLDFSLLDKPFVYLSYPNLYLALPYGVYFLLQTIGQNVRLTYAYLQGYHLIVDRLICGAVIYYLFLSLIKIFSAHRLGSFSQRLIAFIGLLGWMFTPPVLYWTHVAYFSDTAVLLPVYLLFLLALKHRFRFGDLSKRGALLLGGCVFYACGTDWYGVVAVIMILGLMMFSAGRGDSFRQWLRPLGSIAAGALLVYGLYALQLSHYKDGFKNLYEIALFRSLDHRSDPGQILTSTQMLITLFSRIREYLPFWYLLLPGPVPLKGLFYFILLSPAVLLGGFAFRQSGCRKLAGSALVLILIAPLAQLLLLRQHSFCHTFSAFKLAMPVMFVFLICPGMLLALFFQRRGAKREKQTAVLFFSILLFVITGAGIVVNGCKGAEPFAKIEGHFNGAPIAPFWNFFGAADLLLTDQHSLEITSFPPQPFWSANRFVYRPDQLKKLIRRRQVNAKNLSAMNPVFVTLKGSVLMSEVEAFCDRRWIRLPVNVEGTEVMACRSEALRQLYGHNFNKQ